MFPDDPDAVRPRTLNTCIVSVGQYHILHPFQCFGPVWCRPNTELPATPTTVAHRCHACLSQDRTQVGPECASPSVTLAAARPVCPPSQASIISRAVAADPHHGERWQRVSKDPTNAHTPIPTLLQRTVVDIDTLPPP